MDLDFQDLADRVLFKDKCIEQEQAVIRTEVREDRQDVRQVCTLPTRSLVLQPTFLLLRKAVDTYQFPGTAPSKAEEKKEVYWGKPHPNSEVIQKILMHHKCHARIESY